MSQRIAAKLKMAARVYPKILQYRWFNQPAPLLVGFGITNRCNLNCSYCFATLKNRSVKEIPTAKLLDYLDQFIELGAVEIDLQAANRRCTPI